MNVVHEFEDEEGNEYLPGETTHTIVETLVNVYDDGEDDTVVFTHRVRIRTGAIEFQMALLSLTREQVEGAMHGRHPEGTMPAPSAMYADGSPVAQGQRVVIHRWMFDEVVGTIDADPYLSDEGDWVIGVAEDDGTVYLVGDVVEVDGRRIEKGGAW